MTSFQACRSTAPVGHDSGCGKLGYVNISEKKSCRQAHQCLTHLWNKFLDVNVYVHCVLL